MATNVMVSTLNEDPETKPLFDAIDTLRHFKLRTNELPIPQLVVVGDQCSGKSSVLGSIAQISLPVGQGACTRFPIEIALRRSAKRRIRMEIIPGQMQGHDEAAVGRMTRFHVEKLNPDSIDLSSEIIAASESIGVSTARTTNGEGGIGFNDDTLKIEHSWPEPSRSNVDRSAWPVQFANIQVGVKKLRTRLRDELLKQVQERLPEILVAVEREIEGRQAALKAIPPARNTEITQREYLWRQAEGFSRLVRAATYPTYSEYPEFFGNYDFADMRDVKGPDIETVRKRRLQSTVRAMNRVFSAVIWKYGRSTSIDDPERSQDWNVQHPELSDILDHIDDESPSYESSNPSARDLANFLSPSVRRKYLTLQKSKPVDVRQYEMELQDRYRAWIGKEPRSEVNFDFYFAVLHKQTTKWDSLAKNHLDNVWDATVGFVDEALQFNMPNQVYQIVKNTIIKKRLLSLRETAQTRLEELVRTHRTESHVFLDAYPDFIKVQSPSPSTADSFLIWLQTSIGNLESFDKNGAEHIFNLLASQDTEGLIAYFNKILQDQSLYKALGQLLTPRLPKPVFDIMQLALNNARAEEASSSVPQAHVSPESENSRRVIDHTERYYDASVFSFVGYVNAVIVQGIILKGIRDAIFTTEAIGELDSKTVQRVAGETRETSETRAALENEIDQLQGVLRVLESA